MRTALLKKILMQNRQAVALALVVISVVLVAGYVLKAPSLAPGTASNAQLEKYATEVIETCSKDTYPPRCYDTEIPKLMDRGVSMEDSFAVTSIIQNRVHDYYYCHVLGHNLSSKETAKDPSVWTEVVARCPTGMCSNGCLHGAAQERFRDDALTDDQIQALVPQLSTICEPQGHRNFTGLEQASCYHSLGHLTMYISGAQITTATGVCDQIAKKGNQDYTQTCYEGAYMQIFQPLEPEDFALVADIAPKTTAAAEKFCDTYTGERQAACHRESWPLYRDTFEKPAMLERFCTLVPDPTEEQRCYNAMFYVLSAQYNFDQARIEALCTGLPDKRMAQCFANSASRLIETDYRLIPDAIALCTTANAHGVGARCYDELLFYSSFNFHPGSDSFNQLCGALPEPWKTKCKDGEGNNIHPSQNDI
jgi:hypothetical protein